MRQDSPSATPHWIGWLVVAALLLIQFGLFRQVVLREIAPRVPMGYDQSDYLHRAYHGYETIITSGLWDGLLEVKRLSPPNGCLMLVQTIGLFLVMGPGRFVALLPHFLYLAAFECLLVWVLLRWTRRWEVALFGLALVWTTGSPQLWIGGLYDFRIDGLAFSLFGILIGAMILSNAFASRPWSLAVAAIACALVMFRYLMLVHLVAIIFAWLVALLVQWRLAHNDSEARALAWMRLLNTIFASLIVALVSAVVLIPQHKKLWKYYGVGHVTGEEKQIRAAEEGLFTLADVLWYYPRSVATTHAGWLFFTVAALGLVVAAYLWWRRGQSPVESSWQPSGTVAILLGLCLAMPAVVLTANALKSRVVGNVLVLPLIWLAVWPLAWAGTRARSMVVLRGLTGLALVVGLVSLVQASTGDPLGICTRGSEDARQVLALHDDLAHTCLARGWKSIKISTDTSVHFLPPNTLDAPTYERQGILLDVEPGLGGSIFEWDDERVQQEVGESHFVLLREEGQDLTNPAYPLARTLARIRPWLRDYCHASMERVGRYDIVGQRFHLYARPSLTPSGDSGGWVTSKGLHLNGPVSRLRQFPHLRLIGKFSLDYLGQRPNVTAHLRRAGQRHQVDARITFSSKEDYTIEIVVPPELTTGEGQADVHVTFDRYFVPSTLGLGADSRELVVYWPQRIEMTRRDENKLGMSGTPAK